MKEGVDRISSYRTVKKSCIVNEMERVVREYFSTDERFMFYNISNMPHKPMLGRMIN
jgi:hypothetical protein